MKRNDKTFILTSVSADIGAPSSQYSNFSIGLERSVYLNAIGGSSYNADARGGSTFSKS